MEKLAEYLERKSSEVSGAYFLTDFSKGRTYGEKEKTYYLASCSKSVLGRILFHHSLGEDTEGLFQNYLRNTLKVKCSLFLNDFLTHSVDIKDYLDSYDINHQLSNRDVIEEFFIQGSPKKRESFEYGNTGYVILADFIERTWGFENELKKLSHKDAEQFHLFSDEQTLESLGEGSSSLRGKDNQTFGDGGMVYSPHQSLLDNPPFLVNYLKDIKCNWDLFFSKAIIIEEGLYYSYGLFIEMKNNEDYRIFHSGYYGGFIAFWSVTSSGHGFSLVLNHDNIDKKIIESYCEST